MIISFSRLGNYGRLGNQMFQIAGTLGIAHKYGAKAVFPPWAYSQYFVNPLPTGRPATRQVKEKHFHVHDWNLTGDTDILGYLQSEKYFPSAEAIKEQFRFRKDFAASVKAKVPAWVWEKPTICFQIRRGDYVGNPNYYQLSISYYIDALLTHFPDWEDYNILFFSDDIGYCKTHFECLPNAWFCETLTDIEQVCLAGMLDHFIIPNSSFGWWCAWLGEKPHSTIIHCGHLQAGKLLEQNDPKDYWPERWTKHQKDRYHIDLTDVTFTIPVMHDHDDRKKNLDLCVSMLQHCFDTKIVVGEQGGKKFEYMGQFCQYRHFDYKDFHRTKMLNQMAIDAHTPYVANWDADVFIPPMQLYLTVKELRDGADMAYPYDGRFSRIDRQKFFQPVERFMDIALATQYSTSKGSVGGAVIVNRNKFIESGGENENMISYAPEDVERWERWKRLGYRVERIAGQLYHMNHFVGPNSSSRNPYFRANKEELDKIRRMSDKELREYANTWPWMHQYTEQYYREICGGSEESAKVVFELLDEIGVRPKTVVDVGCGVGAWVQNDMQWTGIDYNIPQQFLYPGVKYINHDLLKPIPDIGRFDLAICMEVAEHLPYHVAERLVADLCRLSDTVLFSAAIPHQGGNGHVNEQWQTYWAKLFEKNGYGGKNIPLKHEKVALWYQQNMCIYAKGKPNLVKDYVCPEYYEQIVLHLKRQK